MFNHRSWVLLAVPAAHAAARLAGAAAAVNASFEKTIPHAPVHRNYLANQGNLRGQGNALRIAVETHAAATIFDQDYLDALQKINDEIFLLPGVDRPFMKSLWTPNTRWVAVTEEGFDGSP